MSSNTQTATPTALTQRLDSELAGELAATMRNTSTVTLAEFFSYMDIANPVAQLNLTNITVDASTALRMRNHMASFKHGTYAAVPLLCQGPTKCPIHNQCWFAKQLADGSPDPDSVYPILQPCPVEGAVMQLKIRQYAQQFFADDNIGLALTPTTMSLITKLAELDIYDIRCANMLARGDSIGQGMDMLTSYVEAVNEKTGEVIYGVKEHPILNVRERLQKTRDKILAQLVATPEAKLAQLRKSDKPAENNDLANSLTALNNTLSALRPKLGNVQFPFETPKST